MDKAQTDRTLWRDNGVPVSERFDDPYYSLDNGLAETRHVFLDGNDLPARFRPGFHIAELGFGTGLNLIAARLAWMASGTPGRLRFTSFEAFPMPPEDALRALSAFPDAANLAGDTAEMLADPQKPLIRDDIEMHLITGDARKTLPAWKDQADAWFLDGFSPAKNPELWGADLMAEVARHTAPGGSFATYTAAGDVRRALVAAGFDVTRVPGYGRKRHMSTGRKR
ncbi:tRNA (5-methylaminomethyl-2-thiouridine)(34)-methyltransferase MnmD [Nioella sediminis]|jgi:tRNA U34 5-methylaminomethyl-2-thiouridine-forming methyltransferase MnmC|uniref:tRNA (5-methylaminomethyl-2-thiouridine)(34)-methyltransferase MnmD n=1 Tax=Nioella sediminis TaxID=1912092 RepID=UPI0008FD3E81|nr:tRNA (5-methylaminomethyl-2-thiouridine)(34)-methyltransferase MnmD [Nioella sediminis]TBX28250.1 FAD-dependent oxidoreductase [Roseovarius sp. JS7-11]